MEDLKPGLVLKDNQFNFGYTVLTKMKENNLLHLTTFYNKDFDDLNDGDILEKDCSLSGLIGRITLGQFEIIPYEKFEEVEMMLKKCLSQNKYGLEEKFKLYSYLPDIFVKNS